MKTVRYSFERAIESATDANEPWLKERYQEILESHKDFTRKCDYIGLSIVSLDEKMVGIDEEMNELKQLKESLKCAKEVALRVGAEVFESYGIDRLEGIGISSITLQHTLPSKKLKLSVVNEAMLIDAGFYKKVVDTEALLEAYKSGDYLDLITQHCSIELMTSQPFKKLKINKRRSSKSSTIGSISDSIEEVA